MDRKLDSTPHVLFWTPLDIYLGRFNRYCCLFATIHFHTLFPIGFLVFWLGGLFLLKKFMLGDLSLLEYPSLTTRTAFNSTTRYCIFRLSAVENFLKMFKPRDATLEVRHQSHQERPGKRENFANSFSQDSTMCIVLTKQK